MFHILLVVNSVGSSFKIYPESNQFSQSPLLILWKRCHYLFPGLLYKPPKMNTYLTSFQFVLNTEDPINTCPVVSLFRLKTLQWLSTTEKKPQSLWDLLLLIKSWTSASTTFPSVPIPHHDHAFCSSYLLFSLLTMLFLPDILTVSALISFTPLLKCHLNP